ncbi:UNVERIFIED_CONTAM: hypothetical protein PYX00_006318 [Menopon gallinae]|uniref:Uncharacterized protein n=1 Tax=Menopon gallinae TaxID=328185 RepID=A0AAW2HW91_9NEOP
MNLQFPLRHLFVAIIFINVVTSQCPWHRELVELQSSCICAYNLGQELSVQCDQVDFPKLLTALEDYASRITIDLLYVNNSTVTDLRNGSFEKLTMHNVQLSGCRIRNIEPRAFRGQERSLRNLNLQENELTQVPTEALKDLEKLTLLDLSRNRITKILDGAFANLQLATLKLSDNNVSLAPFAFRGLENSLKNLNLKGTKQKRIPEAIRGLKTLAFLDLAQNALRELPGPGVGVMDGLHSLTALNLERNLIQSVGPKAFNGINDSLSSLSLLNNLITDFPTEAMNSLIELRVLDIGFNLLTEIPHSAFLGNPSLTLLALDGNPLSTVPKESLAHLNNTLRGLSLGGRFLHCDCRLRWVAEWIRKGDLQVTSRERNPQFCGSPPKLKDRGFYSIEPKELVCGKEDNGLKQGIAIIEKADLDDPIRPNPTVINNNEELEDFLPGSGIVSGYVPPAPFRPPATKAPAVARPSPIRPSYNNWSAATQSTSSTVWVPPKNLFTTPTTSTTTTTTTARASTAESTTTSSTTVPTTPSTTTETTSTTSTTTTQPPPPPTTASTTMKITRKPLGGNKSTSSPWRNGQRPPIVMAYPPRTRPIDEDREVMVRSAYRQDNSVIIQWDSDTANILGFRVVYRLFGDKAFKQGPPLEASEREFKIKNVPSQECIVVCVISLEEVNVSPETVPYSQCREVRTVTSSSSNMDKITVAASAAICGTVVIAVVVFVVASRRRSRKLQTLQHSTKQGVSVSSFPVPCCTGFTASPSPGGPLSSLAALNAFSSHKDWDQVSVYSNRSIPRPQVYHIERQGSLNARCSADDIRSHISHASHFSNKGVKQPRSIADGQSQHSFSNSTRYLSGSNAAFNGLVNSRPELRQSRQSLASVTDRLSRMSYPAAHSHQLSRHRPGSRQRSEVAGARPGSRYSTAGSTHTLNNYCDNSDNWTDHDMDIYLARNPTTRNGFVPL